jgi:RNA polymerase sigma factor (sigma-70 family)
MYNKLRAVCRVARAARELPPQEEDEHVEEVELRLKTRVLMNRIPFDGRVVGACAYWEVVIFNLAVDVLRSKRRLPIRDADLNQVASREQAAAQRALTDLLALLAALDAVAERAVKLRFYGGLTFEEIGVALGISSSGAYVACERGIALFRRLANVEDAPRGAPKADWPTLRPAAARRETDAPGGPPPLAPPG